MLLYMSRLKFAIILILNLPIDNGLKESFLFSINVKFYLLITRREDHVKFPLLNLVNSFYTILQTLS